MTARFSKKMKNFTVFVKFPINLYFYTHHILSIHGLFHIPVFYCDARKSIVLHREFIKNHFLCDYEVMNGIPGAKTVSNTGGLSYPLCQEGGGDAGGDMRKR